MNNKNIDDTISWLQLSDLHIFENSATAAFHHSLQDLFYGKVDFITITGDLHQYEKKPTSGIGNYNQTVCELEQIMESIGLTSKKDVFMVPGNHDSVNFRGKRAIIEEIDQKAGDSYDCYFNHSEKLQKSFPIYQSFVETFYGSENIYTKKELINHIQLWHDKIEILHLNTALTCNGDNNRRLLVNLMELSQIKRICPELPLITIAHHSYFCIHDIQKPLLRHYMDNLGVSVYMCGDAHRESQETLKLDNREIPIILCGKSAIDPCDLWSNIDVILYQWHPKRPKWPVEISLYRWNVQSTRFEPSYTFVEKNTLLENKTNAAPPSPYYLLAA